MIDTNMQTSATNATNTSFNSIDFAAESGFVLSVTIILALLIIATVLANGFVCLAFYRQPQLRTVSYYPILSLAIADLLCGTLAMPAYVAKKHVTGTWPERVTCDVFRFTYFLLMYASVLSLMLIGIERFIAIKMPVKHRTWLTTRKMTVAFVISWLDAAFVSILPFFWQRKDVKESCTYNPTKTWSMTVILTNVFFPFLIMLCCHLYTVSFAIHYSRKKREAEILAGARGCSNRITQSAQSMKSSRKIMTLKRERDKTCTLSIVVGVFVVCWAPSSFYYFIQMVCQECYRPAFKEVQPYFNAVVKLLTFINSCVNPLICCWLNKTFRKAFSQSLLKKTELRRRRFNQFNAINTIKTC